MSYEFINKTLRQKMKNNQEKIIKNLLKYMDDEIEKSGSYITQKVFNFRFEYIAKYFNSPDEIIEEGEDLKNFKNKYPKLKNKEIKNALNCCNSKNFIGHYSAQSIKSDEERFCSIILTEKGQGIAISNKINEKSLFKKIFKFLIECYTIYKKIIGV